MKGYNFDVLESFQSYVHNLAENMGISVQEAWVTPAKSTKVGLSMPSIFISETYCLAHFFICLDIINNVYKLTKYIMKNTCTRYLQTVFFHIYIYYS